MATNDTGKITDANSPAIPVGIVGAGRTRQGLGPFLAEFFESEGFVVTGVSGRSSDRAAANAEMIGHRLKHEVTAFASPAALCASGIGALIIASPSEHHLEALRAAVEIGLPTLCEKPLVHENDGRYGAEIIEAFGRQRLLLFENCQWPYVLPAFAQLHGKSSLGNNNLVELGLSPTRPGRLMVQNTVSHLLSLIQAVGDVEPGMRAGDVNIEDDSFEKRENLLKFELRGPTKTIEGRLHLTLSEAPVRPAWLSIDGKRIDRRVGEGYSMTFSADNTEVSAADPTKQLVKRFAQLIRSPDPVSADRERDLISQRFDWYQQILARI